MCLIDDCCERKSVDLVVKFLEVNTEMSEEQNYNMVDGIINNVAPKPKKVRESVLKKLHQKQREIAARSGKKVQERELERKRK